MAQCIEKDRTLVVWYITVFILQEASVIPIIEIALVVRFIAVYLLQVTVQDTNNI